MSDEPTNDGVDSTPKAMTRAEIRAALFSHTEPGEMGSLYGIPVELRAPDLDTVLDFQMSDANNRKQMSANMLIRYVYVPGTMEHVFDDEDVDQILKMPFNKDLKKLMEQITALLGVEPAAGDKSEDQE